MQEAVVWAFSLALAAGGLWAAFRAKRWTRRTAAGLVLSGLLGAAGLQILTLLRPQFKHVLDARDSREHRGA